jgi:type IV pilus assembly protein PilA
MKSKRGFTLIELMVVILIVSILAAVAIPILRGRINSAKWSEGRAMMGSIATAIRAYAAEKGPGGPPPTTLWTSSNGLDFSAGDLTGAYFDDTMFSFNATGLYPLDFTVTCTNAALEPTTYTLDEQGNWSQ